jgi:hypothetical protein
MELTDKKLESQINRLARLKFAPEDAEELKSLKVEYRRALRGCRSDAHLIAVVDWLVDTMRGVPAPADIVSAITSVNAPETVKSPLGCDLCRGVGFVQTQRPVHPPGVLPYMADVAEYCDCARGRWLADAHKRHFEDGTPAGYR